MVLNGSCVRSISKASQYRPFILPDYFRFFEPSKPKNADVVNQ